MVELIVVLVLAAILAGVAAPRFFSTRDFQTRLFTDRTVSTLRYAQKLAVASGCRTRVAVDDAMDRFTITWQGNDCQDAATDTLQNLIEAADASSDGNYMNIRPPNGVMLGVTGPNPFEFHPHGYLVDPNAVGFNVNMDDEEDFRPNVSPSIAITAAGGMNWLIRIDRNSGLAFTP